MYQELILSFEKDIQHNMHTIITGMKLPDNVKDMLSKKTLEIIKITSYKSISPRGILTNHQNFIYIKMIIHLWSNRKPNNYNRKKFNE